MAPTNTYSGQNRLLKAVPADDFVRFFSSLEPATLRLRQEIHSPGQPVEYVYFIERGVTSILSIMADASTIEVGMVGSEGMVGVAQLLDPGAASLHVIVQVPGTALRMPLAKCRRAFDESAAVRTAMLRFASDLLSLSSQTAACNRLHSIEQRCARWLLMAYDRIDSERLPMTHEFLASMLGVRRAGVTVAAQELQRSGLISYRQGEVTIRDPDGLEALACECRQADHARLNRLR